MSQRAQIVEIKTSPPVAPVAEVRFKQLRSLLKPLLWPVELLARLMWGPKVVSIMGMTSLEDCWVAGNQAWLADMATTVKSHEQNRLGDIPPLDRL